MPSIFPLGGKRNFNFKVSVYWLDFDLSPSGHKCLHIIMVLATVHQRDSPTLKLQLHLACEQCWCIGDMICFYDVYE